MENTTTPIVTLLKNFFTGGVGTLATGISDVVNSINAPKEMKDKLNADITDAITKHLELQETEATKQMQAVLDDTKNARDTNVLIQTSDKPSWLSKNIPYLLAIFVMSVWGTCTLYIMGRILNLIAADPKVDMTSVMAMYTGISGMAMIILNFHFGSTHSSKDKDATIQTMAANQAG